MKLLITITVLILLSMFIISIITTELLESNVMKYFFLIILVSGISDVAQENSLSVSRRVQDLLANAIYFILIFKKNLNTVEKIIILFYYVITITTFVFPFYFNCLYYYDCRTCIQCHQKIKK